MTRPSLRKHEKDLKTLYIHMEELKALTKQQNEENRSQISSLVAQVADTNNQSLHCHQSYR